MPISSILQAFLTRHATEPDAFAAFLRDSEAVLAGSGLAEDEKKMVREWSSGTVVSPRPNCPWSIHVTPPPNTLASGSVA